MTDDVSIDISSRPQRESGYALIGTMWLLLLATGLAALLMVRATHGARELAALRADTLAAAREESALETAAADILLNGTMARISALPGEATYDVGGQTLTVMASSESARLDINAAPFDVIDAALQSDGMAADSRALIIANLRQRRVGSHPYSSNSELEADLQRSFGAAQTACIAKLFTVHGGGTSALGPSVDRPEPTHAFAAIRLELANGKRTRRLIFYRGGGAPPLVVVEAGVAAACR